MQKFIGLFFDKCYWHINFVNVAQIPRFIHRQHQVYSRENHMGNCVNGFSFYLCYQLKATEWRLR